jgi:hyperosmotically inducible periplasmic protein
MKACMMVLLLVLTTGACREEDDGLPPRPVATDQSNNQADVELTRSVRDALVSAESLSMMGKNVVVVAAGGKVELSGEVESAAEKDEVERIVRGVSGVTSVVNRIEVKA